MAHEGRTRAVSNDIDARRFLTLLQRSLWCGGQPRAGLAQLLVLHVIDTGALAALHRLGLLAVPSDAAAQRRRLRHHARLNIRQLLESDAVKGLSCTRIIAEGTPFVEIAKAARLRQADLVVLGTYGGRAGSVDKIFFGSTAEKVVRTSGCPVLTVPLSG